MTSRIAVIGTGYVGLTTGACLAHLGHDVVCADIDQAKVDALNAGAVPILEDGLDNLVLEGRRRRRCRRSRRPRVRVPVRADAAG